MRQRELLLELTEAIAAGAPDTLEPLLADAWSAAGDAAAGRRVVVDQVARLTDLSAVRWHARLVGGGSPASAHNAVARRPCGILSARRIDWRHRQRYGSRLSQAVCAGEGLVAGRISDASINAVRERVSIEEIIGSHVALRPPGAGRLKGLCPFHDEKTPSFNVNSTIGYLPLLRLRRGRRRHRLRPEDGGADLPARRSSGSPASSASPSPTRAARRRSTARPASGCVTSRPTRRRPRSTRSSCAPRRRWPARQFLAERGFDDAAAEHFGVGYAPAGWDTLTSHLRAKGFSIDELDRVRAGQDEQPRHADRPLPPPPDVADQGARRRRGRLRRPPDPRRRSGAGQVPEHRRDPAVQEVDRALRRRPRAARPSPSATRP